MDVIVSPIASKSPPTFLRTWLAAWVVPVILASLMALLFARAGTMFSGRDRRPFGYMAIASALSLPLLLALAHGHVMRDFVRRPRLWGVLTGAGVSAAAISILVLTILPIDRDDALLFVFSRWLRTVVALPGVPLAAFIHAAVGVLLGLAIGSIQAAALDWEWTSRFRWCVASVLSGLCTFALVFLCWEIDALSAVLSAAAESVVDRGGGWEGVPILAAWSGGVALVYAFPTGLVMRGQLRRRRSIESDLLVARFD